MWPYFLITGPLAFMAFISPPRRTFPALWGLAFVVIVIFVGLRHHVGMDWNNYLIMIQRANAGSILDSFNVAEPGYALLLWLAGQSGWGIYAAYLIGTLIFAAGLFRYATTTPAPWIALLVAMPYLVVVIAMSAARQAVAAGVLLWLMAEWPRATAGKRAALVLLASCFHLSAIGFLVFILLDLRLPKWAKILGSLALISLTIYILQSSERFEYADIAYLGDERIASAGALFHVILNGGPALVYFLLGRRRREMLTPTAFHGQMVLIAILLIPLSFVFSTAASRFSVYLFPVSMWFFAAAPMFLHGQQRVAFKAVVSVFYVGVLALWLNYANNSGAYRNYSNALFVPSHELIFCCR